MESCTVARSLGLKGLTTHTGGAAGTPWGAQAGAQPQGCGGRGGSHGLGGLGGLQPQGFWENRGIRTIGSSGAQAPG